MIVLFHGNIVPQPLEIQPIYRCLPSKYFKQSAASDPPGVVPQPNFL